MTDTQTLSNGRTTEAQAKTKRSKRQPPPLPSASGASDMSDTSYLCKVDSTAYKLGCVAIVGGIQPFSRWELPKSQSE
jgi:hypothetical protein